MENKLQFAERISLEEYEKQKTEHTQNALKQLQQQMKTYQPNKIKISSIKKNNINDENEISDDTEECVNEYVESIDSEDNDFSDETSIKKINNINLIIKHISNEKTNRPIKKKMPGNNLKDKEQRQENDNKMNEVIYAQHEVDTQTIIQLKQIIRKLKTTLNNESTKNHYLKLDLNNCLIDKDALTTENNYLKTLNISHSNKIKNNQLLILLLILCFILYFLILLVLMY